MARSSCAASPRNSAFGEYRKSAFSRGEAAPSKRVWMCTGRYRVAHSSLRSLRAICSDEAIWPHPSHRTTIAFETVIYSQASMRFTLPRLAAHMPTTHAPALPEWARGVLVSRTILEPRTPSPQRCPVALFPEPVLFFTCILQVNRNTVARILKTAGVSQRPPWFISGLLVLDFS
jgi:hypothetical protein